MSASEMPSELSKGHWDKKKGAVPAGSPLENQLKTFEKKYGAVDWSLYADGWESKAKTAADLDAAYSAVDRSYRVKVFALKMEAQAVADAAQKLLKEKGLAKPTLDAVKAITDAAKSFGKAVDAGVDELEKAHAQAAKALKNAGGDEDEDVEPSALLDPKNLLKQLQTCKRDPARRMNFAFVNDNKAPAAFSMAPRTSAKKLFSTLQDASGVKTGTFGRAWVLQDVLYLEVEKTYSGLVKKVRPLVKTAGFKAKRIVLSGTDGVELESDLDTEDESGAPGPSGDDAPGPGPGTTAETDTGKVADAPEDAQAAFTALLKTLSPQVAQAVAAGGAQAQDIKLKASEAALAGRKQDWALGLARLREVEQMLAAATQPQANTPTTAGPESKPTAGSSGPGPNVAFTQSRLVWDQTRKKIQAELRKLETAILDVSKEEPDYAEIAAGTKNLYLMLNVLDERLMDKLDEALNASDAAARQALHNEAREIVGEYVDFVEGDELLQDIDDNGFTAVAVKSSLTASLKLMDQRLKG